MKLLLHLSFVLVGFHASGQTCAFATIIDINGACLSGSITDATVTNEGYNCGGTIVREAWFTFTLNSSSTLNFTARASNRNLAIQVLSGTCGSLTQLACANANTNTNSSQTESITNMPMASGNYYLRVLNVSGSSNMSLTSLCVSSVPNCSDALQLCTDATFSGNSSGHATQELSIVNRGCLNTNEHQSSWFYFVPATSGTLAMEINTTVDYDFAIWQTGECASLGSPIRCSYSAETGRTGLVPSVGGLPIIDLTEPSSGDKFVAPLSIIAGQTYIMIIDNYTADGTSYSIDFTLTDGATLNCNPIALPTDIMAFKGEASGGLNSLYWTVASELNCARYTIERSTDALHWTPVENLAAGENLVGEKTYNVQDYTFKRNQINYYRLVQMDKQGVKKCYMNYVALDNRLESAEVERIINTMGQEIDLATSGVVIIHYADGTIERRYNP